MSRQFGGRVTGGGRGRFPGRGRGRSQRRGGEGRVVADRTNSGDAGRAGADSDSVTTTTTTTTTNQRDAVNQDTSSSAASPVATQNVTATSTAITDVSTPGTSPSPESYSNVNAASIPPRLPANHHRGGRSHSLARGGRGRGRGRDSAYFNYNNHHSLSRRRDHDTSYRPHQQSASSTFARRTMEDRAAARKTASRNMFYLHSAADFAFWLTRQPPKNKLTPTSSLSSSLASSSSSSAADDAASSQAYSSTYSGPDTPIFWSVVKLVVISVPVDTALQCPICLDDYCCPRVTKCGHAYCLPCLLQHVEANAQNMGGTTTTTAGNAALFIEVKCPCCSLPLHIPDTRPVTWKSTQILRVSTPSQLPLSSSSHHKYNNKTTQTAATKNDPKVTTIQMQKLHRAKQCPTPYLPILAQPRRASPLAAPTASDADAAYSRFIYMDVDLYQDHLRQDIASLQRRIHEMIATLPPPQQQQQLQQHHAERFCLELAISLVHHDLQQAIQDAIVERTIQERWMKPTGGMYLHHPSQLHFEPPSWSPPPLPPKEGEGSNGFRRRDRAKSMSSSESSVDSSQIGAIAGTADDHVSRQQTCATDPVRRIHRLHQEFGGTMYGDDDEAVFYQAMDGSLCFLSPCNMNELRAEYATTLNESGLLPSNDMSPAQSDGPDAETTVSPPIPPRFSSKTPRWVKAPLPDIIEGVLLDIEHVYLTPEVRQRMRFLSHLPLYTDVVLVELSLAHLVSGYTREMFKFDWIRRRREQCKRAAAELRADERARQQEEERIKDLKDRIKQMSIDPDDGFFQPTISRDDDDIVDFTTDAFGPAIGLRPTRTASSSHVELVSAQADGPVQSPGTDSTNNCNAPEAVSPTQATRQPTRTFSQICREGRPEQDVDLSPRLLVLADLDFPALVAPPTLNPPLVNPQTLTSSVVATPPSSSSSVPIPITNTTTSTPAVVAVSSSASTVAVVSTNTNVWGCRPPKMDWYKTIHETNNGTIMPCGAPITTTTISGNRATNTLHPYRPPSVVVDNNNEIDPFNRTTTNSTTSIRNQKGTNRNGHNNNNKKKKLVILSTTVHRGNAYP